MIPEISVIIPVYQDQSGLDRCLQALTKQVDIDLSTVEVIVIDNGSIPAMKLPLETPFHTRGLVCEKKGAYAARNKGMNLAQGKAIAFIDADCWPEMSWLSSGLKALYGSGGKQLIGGEVLFERSPNPNAVECYQLLMGFGQQHAVEELGFSATANLFASRDVCEKLGPFNEDLLSGGDREWSWRALRQGILVCFERSVIVRTRPRQTLRAALIQARRVAGGRRILEKDRNVVEKIGLERIQPKKGVLGKINKILGAPEYSKLRRVTVLGVAILIRLVHDAEFLRISLGGRPERR